MDVNKAYHGDRFTLYTIIESLRCTLETNTVLYVSYTSVKKIKVLVKDWSSEVKQKWLRICTSPLVC